MTALHNYPRHVIAAATRHGITPDQYQANRDAGLKWCRACQEWRPTTDYNPSTSTRDKLRPLCIRHNTPRQKPEHGYTRYRWHGCRCDTCRAANTARLQKAKQRRLKDPEAADRAGHGKANTYKNYGCRCEPCTKANTEYCAKYSAAWRRRQKEKDQ